MFGTVWRGSGTERDVINYVASNLLGDANYTDHVTIVQRHQRRILNVDSLLNVSVRLVGIRRARVVVLEELTVEQQVSDHDSLPINPHFTRRYTI